MKRISKVDIKYIDDTFSKRGGRVLEVKSKGHKTFTTPSIPLAIRTLNSVANLPHHDALLESDLAVLSINLTGNNWIRLCNDNEYIQKISRKLAAFSDSTSENINVPSFHMGPIRPKSSMERVVWDLQIGKGVDDSIPTLHNVSMPPAICNDKEYDDMLTRWTSSSDEMEKGCVPQLLMSEDVKIFTKKLDLIIERTKTDEIGMIDVVYADPVKFGLQYSLIWENHFDIEALIHCSGVPYPTKKRRESILPNPTYDLMTYGIDTTSYFERGGKYIPKGTLDPYKWPDQEIISIIPGEEWEKLDADHFNCDCNICRGKTQDEIKEKHMYLVDGNIDSGSMSSVSKVHDYYSMEKELDEMGKRIRERGILDYRREKYDAIEEFMKYIRPGRGIQTKLFH